MKPRLTILLVLLVLVVFVSFNLVAQQPPDINCMAYCRGWCSNYYGNDWINCIADCRTNICVV